MQPSDGMILATGPRVEGHSAIFRAIQTHLCCRFLPAVGSLGLRRIGSCRVNRGRIGIHIIGFALWCWDAERPTRSVEALGAPAVGEPAVVSDPVAALGQDVDQEAADERVRGQGHDLVPVAALGSAVLPRDARAAVAEARFDRMCA